MTPVCLNLVTLAMIAVLAPTSGAPTKMTDGKTMDFLKRFGYLNANERYSMADMSVKEAIQTFKHNYGVKSASDAMDASTTRMMQMPRCGVEDFKGNKVEWSKLHLTYDIRNYTLNIDRRSFDEVIVRALNLWSGVTDLTFERKKHGPVDIEIGFVRGPHGDGNDFDGEGSTLAHAFYPERGVFHFDGDEDWTIGGNEGTDVLYIATHEFGHILGLGHSDEVDSVMTPMYNGYVPNLQLHDDDIMGIQYLYGPKISEEQDAPQQDKFSLCSDPSIDAALATPDRKTYLFKGMKFWEFQFSGSGLVDGYPRNIDTRWPELPHTLDAAFYSRKFRKTYFFKGMMVWRYKDVTLDRGYPKKISAEFPGMYANNIDAAFEWARDQNMHFFRDGKHWCFDGRRVCSGYPRQMSAWGLPNKVDAALRYDYTSNRMYFFNGRQFYRFDDRTLKPIPPAANTARNLLKCPN